MTCHSITDEYFEWLYEMVCDKNFGSIISYRKLLTNLHNTEFEYYIQGDERRCSDGKTLRRRFAIRHYKHDDIDMIMDNLNGPCSVLEMMTALAIRCEEDIMDNPLMGDRKCQWFWGMIRSLGLLQMSDDRYDQNFVDRVIERFMKRDYEPDGKGGLFTVRNCNDDLRKVEIWWQMCWYLDTIS